MAAALLFYRYHWWTSSSRLLRWWVGKDRQWRLRRRWKTRAFWSCLAMRRWKPCSRRLRETCCWTPWWGGSSGCSSPPACAPSPVRQLSSLVQFARCWSGFFKTYFFCHEKSFVLSLYDFFFAAAAVVVVLVVVVFMLFRLLTRLIDNNLFNLCVFTLFYDGFLLVGIRNI